jgi:hypothetical protein
LNFDTIKQTFEHTTQYARLTTGSTLRRDFLSLNSTLNAVRKNEAVAYNIVYSNVPQIDDGSTVAVLFFGTDTMVTDVYGIKTDKQFINTLEDNITKRGALHKLLSDSAQALICNKIQDILRNLCVTYLYGIKPDKQFINTLEDNITYCGAQHKVSVTLTKFSSATKFRTFSAPIVSKSSNRNLIGNNKI